VIELQRVFVDVEVGDRVAAEVWPEQECIVAMTGGEGVARSSCLP
jgi:hypothetical protein